MSDETAAAQPGAPGATPWLVQHRLAVVVVLALVGLGLALLLVGVGLPPPDIDPERRSARLFLLLLPVGGLVTSTFYRVGLRTFGSFTPTLFALSFLYAVWPLRLAAFVCIVAVGLSGRWLVTHLRLRRRARVSLIMLMLASTLIAAVSLAERWGHAMSLGSVMLPMVALTIMIEHFHIAVGKDGFVAALRRLANTVLVAGVSFSLFRLDPVQQWLLTHPELELFVAAGLILVGLPEPERGSEAADARGGDEE